MKYITICWGLMNIIIAALYIFGIHSQITTGLAIGSAAGYAVSTIILAFKS